MSNVYREQDAERVIVLTTADGGVTWTADTTGGAGNQFAVSDPFNFPITIDFAGGTMTLDVSRAALRKPRVNTNISSATPTPNADTDDFYVLTALAVAATVGAPTGTPGDAQPLTFRFKDNGTARGLTWNAIFRAGTSVALPTTTTISKWLYVSFLYNIVDAKWDLQSVTNGF
jgi:hypothetical protein